MSARFCLSRRALLRGAGGVAIALPVLEAMETHAADIVVPKRLVVWFTPCGHHKSSYPTSINLQGTSFEPLIPFKDDLIVTKGISLVSAGKQLAADHPSGFGHLLTGSVCTINADDVFGGNVSVDQFLAKRLGPTRFASSLHGIGSRRTMSWDRSASGTVVAAMPENNPQAVFNRLYSGGLPKPGNMMPTGPTPAELRHRSILDTVRTSYEQLTCRLGNQDRKRLDAHLESIRAIEKRVTTPVMVAPTSGCSGIVPTLPAGSSSTSVAAGRIVGRAHMELLAQALACDLTRVGTIQWYSHTALYAEANGWDGLESHHVASHANRQGSQDRVYATELAYFLGLLKNLKAEDGRSLLYHTAVVCVSELGLNDVAHHVSDLGITIAGQAGGYFSTGRFIDFLAPYRATLVRAPEFVPCHPAKFAVIWAFGRPP